MLIARLLRIGGTGLVLLVRVVRDRLTHTPPEASVVPLQLCMALERLGPTFVKLGQAQSLRSELLPEPYLRALQGLQERVAPFPTAQAREEIERGLRRPMAALFAEFDDRPLAAASIAQVHRARLHDGRAVVVKIRRPGIRAQGGFHPANADPI